MTKPAVLAYRDQNPSAAATTASRQNSTSVPTILPPGTRHRPPGGTQESLIGATTDQGGSPVVGAQISAVIAAG